MSVEVTVRINVTGTDSPEEVQDALDVRDRYHWPEFGDAVWHALIEAGVTDADVEVDSVDCEIGL